MELTAGRRRRVGLFACLGVLTAASCVPALQLPVADAAGEATLPAPQVAVALTAAGTGAAAPSDTSAAEARDGLLLPTLPEPTRAARVRPLPTRVPVPGLPPAPRPEEGPPPTAPVPVATERFGPVVVQRPALRLEAPSAPDSVTQTLAQDGVAFATEVHVGEVPVRPGQPGEATITVAAVDPGGFRPLAPQVTADALPVWDRLVEGEAAVTHEVGQRLALALGERVLTGPGTPLRIGAYAANGQPAIADAIVSEQTGRALGLDGERALLVAIAPGADPERVAARLELRLGGEAVSLLPPVHVQRAPDPGDTTVWDVLAQCESGGDWAIDTGNGYYGGLQFLPESWRGVGGTDLPNQHPREEQIYRAELLLARQGWNAWPACSAFLGLR